MTCDVPTLISTKNTISFSQVIQTRKGNSNPTGKVRRNINGKPLHSLPTLSGFSEAIFGFRLAPAMSTSTTTCNEKQETFEPSRLTGRRAWPGLAWPTRGQVSVKVAASKHQIGRCRISRSTGTLVESARTACLRISRQNDQLLCSSNKAADEYCQVAAGWCSCSCLLAGSQQSFERIRLAEQIGARVLT